MMDKKEFKEPEFKELDESMDEYIKNPDFREFVDKHRKRDDITAEEAVRHAIVREVEKEYKHKREQYM